MNVLLLPPVVCGIGNVFFGLERVLWHIVVLSGRRLRAGNRYVVVLCTGAGTPG